MPYSMLIYKQQILEQINSGQTSKEALKSKVNH